MCFFNRLRFKCGHTQTCIFQTCLIARHTRGRTYHTTCRPSKRSNRNVRTWDLLGSCENCLRLQYGGRGYFGGTGVGVPGDRYGYGVYDGEGYYSYYPAGDRFYSHGYNPRYWDRGYGYNPNDPFYNYLPRHSSPPSPLNLDECDEANCMNINTPKDIQRNFHRSGWGSPYLSSRDRTRLLDNCNHNYNYSMGYPGIDDAGRYIYQGDVDGMGMRGLSPEMVTATPLRAIEGGPEGFEGVGRRSPFVGMRGRVGHMVD